jgi:hypothetical protein
MFQEGRSENLQAGMDFMEVACYRIRWAQGSFRVPVEKSQSL